MEQKNIDLLSKSILLLSKMSFLLAKIGKILSNLEEILSFFQSSPKSAQKERRKKPSLRSPFNSEP
jgi:hypothetical protein